MYQLVLKHPETPKFAKLFFGLAIGYLLMPFDLIPDFIPILGQLDDVIIIPILLYLAIWLTPKEIIEACRAQVSLQY
ncbi:MAG: YkvA family protein [Methylophilaceae bacterium]